MINSFITSFALQMLFFAFASAQKTDKLTDLSYGLTFVVIAFLTWITNNSASFTHTLLFLMIAFWGIRLGGFLFIRILKTGKDKRFDGVRNNFLKFARFWFLQALSVPIILSPSVVMLSSKSVLPFGLFQILGLIIFLIGLIVETVSDWQKFVFKNNPKNKDKWIQSGIWKYSRHPNYFGEMTLWWGIFIYCLPYLSGWQYLSIIGPVFITILLLFVSGIPPLEKSYAQRYKGNKEYEKYKKSTRLLIPLLKIG